MLLELHKEPRDYLYLLSYQTMERNLGSTHQQREGAVSHPLVLLLLVRLCFAPPVESPEPMDQLLEQRVRRQERAVRRNERLQEQEVVLVALRRQDDEGVDASGSEEFLAAIVVVQKEF